MNEMDIVREFVNSPPMGIRMASIKLFMQE